MSILGLVVVDEEGGWTSEARLLGGLEAALAGEGRDIAVLIEADEDRLEDALVRDGLGELREPSSSKYFRGWLGSGWMSPIGSR